MTSITRRLIVTVLVLELVSAVALVGAMAVEERHVQLKAFDASLVATAESLMGAVQDTEDEGDNVMLDMRGVQVAKNAVFRVEDERGRVLGAEGKVPSVERAGTAPGFRNVEIGGREYRFVIFQGSRIVDPGQADGGTRHGITIVYGAPVGHVWHEVFEAIRFFAIATAILLGLTALVMAWLVRKGLSPVYELAQEADRISSSDWKFNAPPGAKHTVELRPLTDALEAALARLQRSFEQQRRFTSDAAHELKTDVAIVKSSMQLLLMRKRTVEEYSRGLLLGLDDFTRLETTVQRMLTLARLEQPRRSEDGGARFCSLRDAIDEAVNQSKPLAELKSIRVRVALSGDARLPMDSRDALLLFSNILFNALQYSPEGSAVEVTAIIEEERVVVTVRDQGEGIAEEDRPHLFEPFYRGDSSRSRESGGTGLGLSICKAICARVEGSIEISNNASGGTLVTVKLPAEVVATDSAPSASLKAQ
jgi:signal transduction histidine kinase